MRLLLDENLPHQLRHEIPGHVCETVVFMGWAGVSNGELLAEASSEGFDALLTKDGGFEYELNVNDLPIAVVVLHAPSNKIDDIRPLLPSLLQALSSLTPKQITHVT
jgi:predicted nuclease of predicted toxin-antitoxin system